MKPLEIEPTGKSELIKVIEDALINIHPANIRTLKEKGTIFRDGHGTYIPKPSSNVRFEVAGTFPERGENGSVLGLVEVSAYADKDGLYRYVSVGSPSIIEELLESCDEDTRKQYRTYMEELSNDITAALIKSGVAKDEDVFYQI